MRRKKKKLVGGGWGVGVGVVVVEYRVLTEGSNDCRWNAAYTIILSVIADRSS